MAGIEQHLANLDKRVRRLEQIVERQLELTQTGSAARPSSTPESPSQQAIPPEAATPTQALPAGLRGAATPVRIGTLVVLGITLYIGGWLYQKLSGDDGGEEQEPLSNASVG